MALKPSIASKKCIAIIPSIAGWHLLNRLLPTVDLPKDQIFIIDQGSIDGTEQKCLERGFRCIQMHSRATFTKAVNLGIKEALKHAAEYVLVINNDVEFQTPVATQLLKRAESENNLGLISPRQILIKNDKNIHDIRRGSWNLGKLDFAHESGVDPGNPELLEADFCEFTCVLIKSVVFEAVGLLDERYEFYHEDTDFCFRAQIAGFRCAYDQTALIKHFAGATFDKQTTYSKKKLIYRNKSYFANDHLKYRLRFPFFSSTIACSWSTTNEFLWAYLNKYGLLSSHSDAPTLSSIAHPELCDSDYLLTVWETSQLPHSWIKECKKFKHIFVPSHWNKEVFEQSGYPNVSVLPFGVDTDIYNPWGPKLSFPWTKSILCIFQNQYRKGLDVTLRMWNQIRSKHSGVFLVLYGKNIECINLNMNNYFGLKIGNFFAKIDLTQQIALLQPAFAEYVNHMDMATLYRSCELYLLNSRSEGFGYPILEAMACGSVCVIPNYGATKEFIREKNCIFFEGTPVKANYSDKGFEDVGNWWEPDLKDLCLKVDLALQLDSIATTSLRNQARQTVLSNYTWRHSVVALRKHLEQLQHPLNQRIHQRTKITTKYRKKTASVMHVIGLKFLKAGSLMEMYGLKGVMNRITSKIFRERL
jgi:GT2 family glycosyltransferase